MTQILGKAQVSLKDIETDLLLLRRTLRSTNVDLQVRVPLRSENYVPGTAGWNFDLNGNAELNNVTARGTIEASGVFTGTLGANTVNAINISADQITADFLSVDRLQVNSINGNRISNDSLDGGKIVNGSIGAGKIGNLEITADKIANLTIDASKIMNLQINNDKIADGAVSTVKIANLAVTDAKIESLSASKITAGTITGLTLNGATGTFLSLSIGGGGNTSTFSNTFVNQIGNSNFTTNLRNSGIVARTGTLVRATANGTFGLSSSSLKVKENVRDAENLETLLDIRPVFFDYKRSPNGEEDDPTRFNVYGAIAEEVDGLGLQSLVYYDEDGPRSIDYEKIGLALIPYVKDLKSRVEALENSNE